MDHYVALITDYYGAAATVYVRGANWSSVCDQLEDLGCEVGENLTEEYDLEDFLSPAALQDAGLLTIDQLLNDSTFIPHP